MSARPFICEDDGARWCRRGRVRPAHAHRLPARLRSPPVRPLLLGGPGGGNAAREAARRAAVGDLTACATSGTMSANASTRSASSGAAHLAHLRQRAGPTWRQPWKSATSSR